MSSGWILWFAACGGANLAASACSASQGRSWIAWFSGVVGAFSLASAIHGVYP